MQMVRWYLFNSYPDMTIRDFFDMAARELEEQEEEEEEEEELGYYD